MNWVEAWEGKADDDAEEAAHLLHLLRTRTDCPAELRAIGLVMVERRRDLEPLLERFPTEGRELFDAMAYSDWALAHRLLDWFLTEAGRKGAPPFAAP